MAGRFWYGVLSGKFTQLGHCSERENYPFYSWYLDLLTFYNAHPCMIKSSIGSLRCKVMRTFVMVWSHDCHVTFTHLFAPPSSPLKHTEVVVSFSVIVVGT